ncbi:ABC transporter permease [Dactylosporangium sp. NPDC051541]|uniref:ABC transporter permease n=1 Tax=Dactylosporangium sp. NPDC051541 TaxID=3363977 RepID=UPI0037878EDB
MSWSRITAIAGQDLRILRRDPFFVIVATVMPLLLMGFLNKGLTSAAAGPGVASGAAQVVPGMSLVFAFFSVANLGYCIFREHGWNTWDRLRASHAGTADIMVGKTLVPAAVLTVQMGIFFTVGSLLTGLHVNGSVLGVVFVAALTEINVLCLGLLLVALCRNIMQLNAIANLGSILLAGLGGALAPVALLPQWVQWIARLTPGYWAMEGFREVIVVGSGVVGALRPMLFLLAFSAAFAVLAWRRFRIDESKGVAWG